jgi:DNA-binding PadR family transcriptional regulator
MYKDNSLIPTEAVRLAALGTLQEGPRRYADLAAEVRGFVAHIVGPSLDLIGPPMELLRVEGLVAAANGGADAELQITPAGVDELKRLLGANLRGPIGEFNKLVIALKLRFLPVLDREGQKLQAELLAEICERELARLTNLRRQIDGRRDTLTDWLEHDIAQVTARLEWFRQLGARL